MRTWIASALLAVSWLLGLHYYQPADWPCWAMTVALGVLLFAGEPRCLRKKGRKKGDRSNLPERPEGCFAQIGPVPFFSPLPARRDLGIAFFAMLPAVWFLGWPYRAAPLLVALGTAILWVRIPRRWPKSLAWGAVKAGTVLFAQSLAIQVYMSGTARCHDLPWPLPSLVGWVASLAGFDAAVDGKSVVIHSIAQVHRLTATWDLLVDPVTLLFFVGAAVALGLGEKKGTAKRRGQVQFAGTARGVLRTNWTSPLFFSPFFRLALVIAAWLPVRVGLLMAIMLDRGLRADPNVPPALMNQFFDARVHLLLLVVPVLLAWRFVRPEMNTGSWLGRSDSDPPEPEELPSSNPSSSPGSQAPASPGSQAPAWEPRVSGQSTGKRRFPSWSLGIRVRLSPFFRRYLLGLAAIGLAVAVAAFLFHWDPVGRAKGGRVMFVERHSEWEPTTRPYDTESYGEDPSYSYSGIYKYCGQFYQMSQLLEESAIDDRTLAGCDVLVVKTPTARYSRDEVTAIERFVEAGGGLLLVGEHTNVMNTSTYLNDVARPFGFKFRHDLLFCIGSPYVQWVVPATVPHPAVQHVPPMHYAVSCSIDPGISIGRAVVRNTGLWNLPPDYNSENFFPQAEYRADMRYGAFIQLWATRHGRGRVAAFTDSTIFSNFSTFEPGKPELMLGMLQWLNHRSMWDNGWARLLLFALMVATVIGLAVGGTVLCRSRSSLADRTLTRSASEESTGRPRLRFGLVWPRLRFGLVWFRAGSGKVGSESNAWLPLLAVGTCGWTLGAMAVLGLQHWAMPPLEVHTPMKRVVLDRTVSQVPLSRGGFTDDDGLGYGLVEQWIPRLGYYTTRQSGPAAFSGDLLVVIAPTRSVSREFRQQLAEYVADGGKLLVFDSPDVEGTTSGSLLWPFGMEIDHRAPAKGELRLEDGWPAIELGAVCEVRGGEPFMWVGETPVASRSRFGNGSVTAIGFGSLMNDSNMGYHWMAEPGEFEQTIFDLLFMLIRSAVEDEPAQAPR